MALTQTERILHVLSDGGWHSTAAIHARAGTSRLNSRISDLRKKGENIICEHVPNRGHGSRAYRYKWLNPRPMEGALTPAVAGPPAIDNDSVPRDAAHRFRIYCVPRFGEQTLIGWAATPEQLGMEIVKLGESGDLKGCIIGVLDTHGVSNEVKPGTWILNPHEGKWL